MTIEQNNQYQGKRSGKKFRKKFEVFMSHEQFDIITQPLTFLKIA